MKSTSALLLISLALILSGCGGGSQTPSTPVAPPTIKLQLSSNTLRISHAGDTATVSISVTSTATSVALTVNGVPSGVSSTIVQPTASAPGTIAFQVTNAATAPAATYPLTISASGDGASTSTSLSLLVSGIATVGSTGSGNAAFMSTSFQVAQWSYAWITENPKALVPLAALSPHHIRLQIIGTALPETATDQWDFTQVDAITQPILAVDDLSPEFQIGDAPSYMYNSSGKLRDGTYQEFATFCANLVRYYNKGGFTVNGTTYVSPSPNPITWWGIYNEPNINNVTADEYVAIYNTVVPAMLAVDPTIKFAAIELSDWGSQPQAFLPPLLAGATAPINAIATHYYGTCNQTDSDQTIMNAVAGFTDHVTYFRTTLDASPNTAGIPLWVTENNVNADYDNNGVSACNPPNLFVDDHRGSTPFFAAWRPLVYSQLTKAGMGGLWHWSYTGDAQYGEVDGSGNTLLSYWVDDYLSNWLPSSSTLLSTESTDAGVEVLAATRADNKRVVMVANHQVANPSDNNGSGVPKTITVDLSSLGAYTSATLVTMDSSTNAATGPTPSTITPAAAKVDLTFPGYGVQFLLIE